MICSGADNDSDSVVPDLTPLLDIIFIVMVFLLLTANAQINTLEISVPQTQEASVLTSPETDVITINILQEAPFWGIEGNPIDDWAVLTETLLENIKRYPEKTVVIAADKQANIENMLAILALMQKHNINVTHIMMEEK